MDRLSIQRLSAVLGLLYLLCSFAHASEPSPANCAVCRLALRTNFVWITLPAVREKQAVCVSCSKLETRCLICQMPVLTNYLTLDDGHLLCQTDARSAVLSQIDAERIFEEAKRDLLRIFSGFGHLPNRNITVSLVNSTKLASLFDTNHSWHGKSTLMGLTDTHLSPNQTFEHHIFLLQGLNPARLMAVTAHEYSHAWIHENIDPDRKIEAETVEGFCELVAHKLMTERHEELEQRVILDNAYSKGRLQTLLKAEADYRFYRIIDWIKTGTDAALSPTNTARVLALQQAAPEGPWAALPPPVQTPVADTLVLKGISLSNRRRFALVNNCTLAKNERARIRVGQTNVVVQCIDILQSSVILRVNNSLDATELFLKP